MWHMTYDMWHMTKDTRHMKCGGRWIFSQNFTPLALTVWEWRCSEDLEKKGDSVNLVANEHWNMLCFYLGLLGWRWIPRDNHMYNKKHAIVLIWLTVVVYWLTSSLYLTYFGWKETSLYIWSEGDWAELLEVSLQMEGTCQCPTLRLHRKQCRNYILFRFTMKKAMIEGKNFSREDFLLSAFLPHLV